MNGPSTDDFRMHRLPDAAQEPLAELKGHEVTLHNVRNCDYRTETDYTPPAATP